MCTEIEYNVYDVEMFDEHKYSCKIEENINWWCSCSSWLLSSSEIASNTRLLHSTYVLQSMELSCWNKYFANKWLIVFSAARSTPLDDVLHQRRHEAARSVVFHTHSVQSYAEILNYSAHFGDIRNTFHYRSPNSHHILLEYADPESAEAVAKHNKCTHNREIKYSNALKWKQGKNTRTDIALSVTNGTQIKSPQILTKLLRDEQSIDKQIIALHNQIRLNELGVRLRFLATDHIEGWTRKIWPACRLYPFGSSINGLGKMDSDVDLTLCELPDEYQHRPDLFAAASEMQYRLYSMSKLKTISKKLRMFSNISDLDPVLNDHVRVPIVKFHDSGLHLDLDISVNVM